MGKVEGQFLVFINTNTMHEICPCGCEYFTNINIKQSGKDVSIEKDCGDCDLVHRFLADGIKLVSVESR